MQDAAAQYFEENVAPSIFPEMQELVRRLREAGCEVWAVSSTNEWVIRAAMKHFGIPPKRILAAAASGKWPRYRPTDPLALGRRQSHA